jgi:hypothetical protein
VNSPGPPETTTDHFRDPLPSRIMESWRVQAQGRPTPHRAPLKRRHKPRADRQPSGSQPQAGDQHGVRRVHKHDPHVPRRRTKITVRAFVSLRCHDHPEWTSNKHDTQGRNRTPAVRPITEKNTWSTASSRSATYTGRPAARIPHRREGCTRSPTTQQTVRAFGQKYVSQRSGSIHGGKCKRPAELAFCKVGLTGFEPATP